MKKWMMVLAVVFGLSVAAPAGIGENILLWAPNRLLDFTDIFSVGLGLGGLKVEARATRAVDFSIGEGFYLMARKDYRRQIGFSLEQGYHLSFFYVGIEDYDIDASASRCLTSFFPLNGVYADTSLKCANFSYKGWPSPCSEEYHFNKGTRDWWEFALEAGVGLVGRLAVHPIEIVDFAAGIFCIDFMDDDIKSE